MMRILLPLERSIQSSRNAISLQGPFLSVHLEVIFLQCNCFKYYSISVPSHARNASLVQLSDLLFIISIDSASSGQKNVVRVVITPNAINNNFFFHYYFFFFFINDDTMKVTRILWWASIFLFVAPNRFRFGLDNKQKCVRLKLLLAPFWWRHRVQHVQFSLVLPFHVRDLEKKLLTPRI